MSSKVKRKFLRMNNNGTTMQVRQRNQEQASIELFIMFYRQFCPLKPGIIIIMK